MANFKARARAIDMLGRQQISGIPSAISELFKNAHDAYADRVEVDFYRSDNLFVLRDDGIGMTEEDFETRWLTLGTESKMPGQSGMIPPPSAPGKTLRPILGEKGIGRLAIAAIGAHVLILTRAKREGVLHDLIASYIHWRIFEMPGIDLNEIEIPIRTFSNGSLPDKNEVSEMVDAFAKNLDKIKYLGQDEKDIFIKDFNSIKISALEVDSYLPDMSLSGQGHGTHFLIIPANEILKSDIDSSDETIASSLEKALLGFTNKMTPGHKKPAIKTAFRDHKKIDDVSDIIDDRSFFSPEEFGEADHHFQGRFDEYGQFVGTVSVFQEPEKEYKISWNKNKGKKTECGPFQINIAYIQGSRSATTMSVEQYNLLQIKTKRLGGLYIYKSGIRILPYGDTDYDWLEIEKRRTLKASTAFFSHRYMFGAIEIDHVINRELSEKAGREGFRENKAYREFREVLRNMLMRFAADFFVENGLYSELYNERRAEFERLDLARRKRAELTSEKRKKLEQDLTTFFDAYENQQPLIDTEKLSFSLRLELSKAIEDEKNAAYLIIEIESKARQQLRLLEEKYRVVKPKGIGLNKRLEQAFNDYSECFQILQGTIFFTFKKWVEEEVTQVAEKARLELDRRVRIERALNDLASQAKSMGVRERRETFSALTKVESEVREVVKDSISQINEEVQNVLIKFNSIDFDLLEESKVVDIRDEMESKLIEIKERKQELLRTIRAQLEAINLKDDIGQLEQMEALEQKMLTMEERSDMDLQLTQLGMAIEVINHEFDSSIRAIRKDLRRLKGWADVNKNLDNVYTGLRTSFEHLDGYLNLFTPLHRRLHRQEVDINGSEISTYINDLFRQRFERHQIVFKATPAFLKHSIRGYASSFYPVFVNLTDNAIFWLRDSSEQRIIEFHAEQESFLISNNGPSILESRKDVIFESGISFKPGGRGLGLAISSEVLNKIGFSLSLEAIPRKNMNVTFCIALKK